MSDSFIYSSKKNIEKEIGKIEKFKSYHFFSEGSWSMHELLIYLLSFTGTSKVWITTFSISEVAIRSFLVAQENNLITEMNCLFDYSTKKNKLELLLFADNVVNQIKLASNHSKLILIENNDWKIIVNGSANMSPNLRYEAGVICTIPEIVNQYKTRLIDIFNKSIPFK